MCMYADMLADGSSIQAIKGLAKALTGLLKALTGLFKACQWAVELRKTSQRH